MIKKPSVLDHGLSANNGTQIAERHYGFPGTDSPDLAHPLTRMY